MQFYLIQNWNIRPTEFDNRDQGSLMDYVVDSLKSLGQVII